MKGAEKSKSMVHCIDEQLDKKAIKGQLL